MKSAGGVLIAVDGVSGSAVATLARKVARESGRSRGGISWWDASGLFEQLASDEGAPSPRTLLLLYAADLAFRLRWEIQPSLDAGKTVVAAPYVDTAIAFGRAAGLAGGWLSNLFRFAPPVAERRHAAGGSRSSVASPGGFVDFTSTRLSGYVLGMTKKQLVERTRAHLASMVDRSKRRSQAERARVRARGGEHRRGGGAQAAAPSAGRG